MTLAPGSTLALAFLRGGAVTTLTHNDTKSFLLTHASKFTPRSFKNSFMLLMFMSENRSNGVCCFGGGGDATDAVGVGAAADVDPAPDDADVACLETVTGPDALAGGGVA